MPLLRSIHLVATIFTLTIIFASTTITLVSASITGNTTTTTTSVGGEEQEAVRQHDYPHQQYFKCYFGQSVLN